MKYFNKLLLTEDNMYHMQFYASFYEYMQWKRSLTRDEHMTLCIYTLKKVGIMNSKLAMLKRRMYPDHKCWQLVTQVWK